MITPPRTPNLSALCSTKMVEEAAQNQLRDYMLGCPNTLFASGNIEG